MSASRKHPATQPLASPALLPDDQAIALEIARLPRSEKAQLAMQFLGINRASLATKYKFPTSDMHKARSLKNINPKLIEGILGELVKELDLKPAQAPNNELRSRPKSEVNSQEPSEPRTIIATQTTRQPVKLNALIATEHPSVAAFVLSSQPTARVAELLQKLHPVRAQKIALTLSDIECKRRRFPKKSGNIIQQVSRMA